jgi:hypothetical protein
MLTRPTTYKSIPTILIMNKIRAAPQARYRGKGKTPLSTKTLSSNKNNFWTDRSFF